MAVGGKKGPEPSGLIKGQDHNLGVSGAFLFDPLRHIWLSPYPKAKQQEKTSGV